MTETAFGKFYTFKPPQHITLGQEDCMTIVLVPNFTFNIFAHDEKFFLKNFNHNFEKNLDSLVKSYKFGENFEEVLKQFDGN